MLKEFADAWKINKNKGLTFAQVCTLINLKNSFYDILSEVDFSKIEKVFKNNDWTYGDNYPTAEEIKGLVLHLGRNVINNFDATLIRSQRSTYSSSGRMAVSADSNGNVGIYLVSPNFNVNESEPESYLMCWGKPDNENFKFEPNYRLFKTT